MVVYNKKILAPILFFLVSFVGTAAQYPAPPMPRGSGPQPPGLPIDEGLGVLFALALVLGVYKIIRFSKNTTKT